MSGDKQMDLEIYKYTVNVSTAIINGSTAIIEPT